jgi:Rod binding domain-containing protein
MTPLSSTPQVQSAKTQQPLDAHAKLRLQNAVKEFEAVLVGYMLKSMRSSTPKDDMFGESYGGDMLEGMFDIELARHVSRSSSLGIGEMLYKKITGEEMSRTAEITGSSPAARTPAAVVKPETIMGTGTHGTAVNAATTQVPDTVRQRVDVLSPIIRDASEKHGVDANLISAVIAAESAGRRTAQSSKNAKGLMQLIDTTANAMGVSNVWDARQNVNGGTKYLSQLLERFNGNLEKTLASYNAGPGAVEKHQGVPPYRETQEYVDKVLQYIRYFEQQEPGNNDQD